MKNCSYLLLLSSFLFCCSESKTTSENTKIDTSKFVAKIETLSKPDSSFGILSKNIQLKYKDSKEHFGGYLGDKNEALLSNYYFIMPFDIEGPAYINLDGKDIELNMLSKYPSISEYDYEREYYSFFHNEELDIMVRAYITGEIINLEVYQFGSIKKINLKLIHKHLD